MKITLVATLRRCSMLLLASSFCAFAADPAITASAMNAELVKTGLYLIQGGGANTLMRLSANGLIVVDGKSRGMYRDLMSQIRKINKISDLPVRALILTGADESRSGDLARFAAAKVPIVVRTDLKPALDARALDPPPNYVTFDDAYTIRLGGIEVKVLSIGRNTIVHFPLSRVVALGDLYRVPSAADDNNAAWSAQLDETLKLDFDIAVPGEGAPVSRADVVALKAKLDAAR